MGDPTKLRIGDVNVFFKGVELGYTKGGVEFTLERDFEDLTVDQHGSMPLDMAVIGSNVLVKCMLAEATELNMVKAVPEGLYNLGSASDDKMSFGRDAGYLLAQDAGVLRLHPRNKAVGDLGEDIYIWKAVSVESIELAYKIDEQRVLEITFRGLVDINEIDGRRLGQIGDNPIS